MSDPGGAGRRGRHSAGDTTGGIPILPGAPGPVPGRPPVSGDGPLRPRFEPWADAGSANGRVRRVSGLLDRREDRTGPLPESEWRSSRSTDHPGHLQARHSSRDDDGPSAPRRPEEPPQSDTQHADTQHPSAPLPPRPAGVWDRLQPRVAGAPDDDATVAHRFAPDAVAPVLPGDHGRDAHLRDADPPGTHPAEGETDSWDRTGGLEVLGEHDDHDDDHLDDHYSDGHRDLGGPPLSGDDAVAGAPPGRRAGRRRRPLAVVLSLLLLAGLVVGIVFGAQALLGGMEAEDYTGAGTGSVEVRIQQGDTLSDIARTLADADVIASTEPFVEAAESRPEATGIQPGLYGLRSQMSGQAALDLLLGPESRLLTRVTIPEGLTVPRVLERIAAETGRPIEEVQAAAADVPALGLPAYAGGQLEGYLFPATYDVEPDDAPADILRAMVQQFTTVATGLRLEERAAALGRSPGEVVTVASMIQSETRLDAERPDVAQVIYNRLAQGVPLGIDAALAFGLDKGGNELTVTDLRTDSPYNTRTRAGLPPTAISSPGEASLEAALAPSTGDLLYYVLENADGTHFFTADYDEFLAARQRCAQAGLGCGG